MIYIIIQTKVGQSKFSFFAFICLGFYLGGQYVVKKTPPSLFRDHMLALGAVCVPVNKTLRHCLWVARV